MWPGGSPTAVVNGAAAFIIAALVILGLHEGRELLVPLALAGILSFILFPLVRRLTNWGLPQGIAAVFIVATVIAAIFAGVTFAGRQVTQLLEEIPRHETTLRDKARYIHSFFGGSGIWQRAIATLSRVEEEVRDPETEGKPLKIEVAPNRPLTVLLEYTRSTLPSIATAGLALVMTIFMLLQYGELRDRVLRLMGAGEIGRSTQALNEASYDLANFLLLQTALNVAFGALVGIALWWIGVPSPGLWGTVSALMRFVPYVGSALSAVFPIALAAMIDSGWTMLLETAVVFIGGDIIVGQFIEPLLYGSHTRLSPIAVVLGAAFWTLLWGPVGLLLAVPLTLTIVVIGQHVPHLDFVRILFGNEPVLEPREKLYRQVLAGDVAEAAKEAERWLDEIGYIKYLDEVAIPALHIASIDRRRGVLGKEQLDDIQGVLLEYVAHVKELVDFKREQRIDETGGGHAVPPAKEATAVVIAGRGIVDQGAAELIADAVRGELRLSTQCPSLGGLTGISSAADALHDLPMDIVVVISVGEATEAQLGLLQRRARSVFNGATIVVGYWDARSTARPFGKDESKDLIVVAETVESLLHIVGRIADERTTTPRRPPPPLKIV